MALIEIGAKTIENLSDGNPRANIMNEIFEQTRDELLAEYDWNFAKRRRTLSAEVTRSVALGQKFASNQEFTDNIDHTRTVAEMAHRCGVSVVGELGYVAGKEGEGAEQHPGEAAFTLPSEAKAYVERTGVDFLAVSIGTVQGRMNGRAKLDYVRLKQLNHVVITRKRIRTEMLLSPTRSRNLQLNRRHISARLKITFRRNVINHNHTLRPSNFVNKTPQIKTYNP